MKLNEILDKPFQYQLNQKRHDWIATFKDDSGEKVTVTMEYWDGPELYDVNFERKGSFGMTNDSPADKHQAIRIISTVIEILKDFVKQAASASQPAKFLTFSSSKEDSSRGSVYARIVKRVGPALGYDVVNDASKIDHKILPGWWKNKMDMVARIRARDNSAGHEHTLLVNKSALKET